MIPAKLRLKKKRTKGAPRFALVPTDGKKRRSLERRLYRAKALELKRHTQRLQTHLDQDAPGFQRWFETEFAKQLTTIRKLDDEIEKLTRQGWGVAQYAEYFGIEEFEAYRIYKEACDRDREANFWSALEARIAGSRKEEEEDDPNSSLGEFSFDPWDEDRDGIEGSAWSAPLDRRQTIAEGYLKAIYRQLVRLTHPDMVGNSARHRSLWARVQDAYSRGQLQELHEIFNEIQHGSPSPEVLSLDLDTMPVGDLIALRGEMQSRLVQIRAQLKTARKAASWRFTSTRKNDVRLYILTSSFQTGFEQRLAELKFKKSDIQEYFRSLQSQGDRVKKKSRGRKNTSENGQSVFSGDLGSRSK